MWTQYQRKVHPVGRVLTAIASRRRAELLVAGGSNMYLVVVTRRWESVKSIKMLSIFAVSARVVSSVPKKMLGLGSPF